MSDFRSDAERFVTEFLDYVYKYDIRDQLNKQTQRMERSPGVETLVKMAQAVFPERKPGGKSAREMTELTAEQRDEAIAEALNVIDTRAQFSARIAMNGGLRGLVMAVGEGSQQAIDDLVEFVKAEKGLKEFHEPLSE